MRITKAIPLFAAAAAVACSIGLAQQAPPPPPATLAPPLVDFGVVGPGTKHPAKFTLRNTGAVPLTIESVTPSCKCTDITPLAGKVIQPGATLEFEASLSVPKSPGDKDAKVFVKFAGYDRPVIAMMKGDVTLPIRAAPPYLDAQKGKTGGSVLLTALDGKPFKVLSAGGKAPVLVAPAGAAGGPAAAPSQTLSWSIAGVPTSELMEWWVVETDRADCPLIPLRVRNEATGMAFDPARLQRFWFPPESIVLAGRMKAGQSAELATTIEHLNPSAQGRVTRPDWGDVKAVRVPGGEGTAELVKATKRAGDFVDIVFTFSPKAGVKGIHYIPVEVETPTGVGKVYVSVAVDE